MANTEKRTGAVTRPLQVLMTKEEADRIVAAAKADGRTISAWCRRVLLVSLELILEELPPLSRPQARRMAAQGTEPVTGGSAAPDVRTPAPLSLDAPSAEQQALDALEAARPAILHRCAPHKHLLPCPRCR